MKEPILDIRHISIIDSLPVHDTKKEVLNVGCGDCKVDYHLIKMGYKVYSTDYEIDEVFHERMKDYYHTLDYHTGCNIFDIKSFPVQKIETVICSEVLEHIVEYKKAFKTLLELAEKRLIITVPFKKSYNNTSPPPVGHCNFWVDTQMGAFKNINEFIKMAKPYAISIQKIRTKERDIQMNQYDYLIIIDKKQKYNV